MRRRNFQPIAERFYQGFQQKNNTAGIRKDKEKDFGSFDGISSLEIAEMVANIPTQLRFAIASKVRESCQLNSVAEIYTRRCLTRHTQRLVGNISLDTFFTLVEWESFHIQ